MKIMRIYNTLTRKIEEFKPIKDNLVTIYTCGPTVYDYAHIGHWFNYVRMDILIRTLKANSYRTKWVMNITDVGHLTSDADEGEDKIQKKALKEHKNAYQIAEFYTKHFLKDMHRLNILEPDYLVKATDHIKDQIDLILKLQEKGYTYEIEGDGIYYDTSKFAKYADFAKLDLDEQEAGIRVQFNPKKRNASDFALWKFSPKNSKRDMEWDSPFGKGFPGWHIECSAMSMKYLGNTMDFHTGGIDHIPVHHTNEIAQSEAVTGQPLAHYWMHSNHVLIDNQKISKSLGNGISLDELIANGCTPMTLRLHILESHYQSQSKFSYKSLDASKKRLEELYQMAVLKYQLSDIKDQFTFNFKEAANNIKDLLSNNLKTPEIMAFLSDICTQTITIGISKLELNDFVYFLKKIDQYLGLDLEKVKDITKEQKDLILKRDHARKAKEWHKSDAMREELLKQNIKLNDFDDKSYWYRIL